MSDAIKLIVNGRIYTGWTSARISRSIEQAAGSFSLAVSERWAGREAPWPIGEGDACVVKIGDERVITGWIDKRSPSFDAGSHGVTISGRDTTSDLVDCSADLTSQQFAKLGLVDLAEKLCAPYDISVIVQAGLVIEDSPAKRKKKTAANPGEHAWAVLEQACRAAGVLAYSDGSGNLVLSRAGSSRCVVDLAEGVNLLQGSAEYDVSGRFRTYEVVGQHQGADDLYGTSAAAVKGSASDPSIRAVRKLVVKAEHSVTTDSANKRAAWESAVRAARGDQVNVVVQGWRQKPGMSVWPINALVSVRSPVLGVKGDMLVTAVAHEISDSTGTTTAITLRRPDAFRPELTITSERVAGYWKELVGGV